MESGQPVTLCVLVDRHDVFRDYADMKPFVDADKPYGAVLIPGESGAYILALAERSGHGAFRFHRIRAVGPGVMRHRDEGVKTDPSTVTVQAGPFYSSQINPVVKQLMAFGFEGSQIEVKY